MTFLPITHPLFTTNPAAQNLSLEALENSYTLAVFDNAHSARYQVMGNSSAVEADERIGGPAFIRLIKLAANMSRYSHSPSAPVVFHPTFQAFARSIKGAETLSSKWHRAVKKASYLSKGLLRLEATGKEGKMLHKRYWQEALLPYHPNGTDLADYFSMWKGNKSTHLSFEDWMMQKHADHLPSSVQYLNAEERKAYSVFIRDGKAWKGDQIFTTKGMATDKKDGAVIYVIGPDEVLYIGPYLVGKFQHSSFFSGQPVLGAGEIIVNTHGEIVEISSKSGHHVPTAIQLCQTLLFLGKHGVNLSRVGLVENSRDTIRRHPSARDFLTAASPESLEAFSPTTLL